MPGGFRSCYSFLSQDVFQTVAAHVVIATGLLFYCVAFALLYGVDVNTPFWTCLLDLLHSIWVGLRSLLSCDGFEGGPTRTGQSSIWQHQPITTVGCRVWDECVPLWKCAFRFMGTLYAMQFWANSAAQKMLESAVNIIGGRVFQNKVRAHCISW